VVVVGGGAREHVLATVLARNAETVVVTPGNAGIPGSTTTPAEDLDADLFVIGPEAPLVEGLADRLRAQGKRVFGPGADGAKLEGSKAWMKEVVAEAGVPTARYESFTDPDRAVAFLKTMPTPYVVKTDGLAAGKGVLVTDSLTDAEADVRSKLAGETFAGAGRTVVIEEGMTGPELSVLAICDGENALLLPAAQDFKRERDNDEGPNTGGMGAYSPVPGVDVDALDIQERFIEPTLNALRKRDIDYRGVLYAGLMLTPDGPKLVEFNVRFGDPESECVLPRITGDLTEVLARAADGRVPARIAVGSGAAVTVMAAGTDGGAVITGVDDAGAIDGVSVVHARTALDADGRLVTAGGGRILGVTGEGDSLLEARERAYAGMARIAFEGMHYRSDIAKKASESEAKTEGERERQ
jgi:phosphoribosylamine--glycine ligase